MEEAARKKKRTKLHVAVRGGGSLVNCRPVFSRDSKYLLCASGSTLEVYSVENDVCCKSMRGHKLPISCLVTNPKNQFQVFSCSDDKTVICWDFIDGKRLSNYKFQYPLVSLFPLHDDQDVVYGLIQVDVHRTNCSLVKFSFKKSIRKGIVHGKPLLVGLDGRQNLSAMSDCLPYVACVKSRQFVVTVFSNSKSNEFRTKEMIKSIACHPRDFCVVTGCKDGRIFVWRNVLNEPVATELHWHALDVCSVMFSMEGSYLLSGGYECVLAKWMLDSASRRPSDTLPRLGAPIVNLSCSPDNLRYAVCYIDNGIQIIGNNFFRGPTIQGFTRGHGKTVGSEISEYSVGVGLICDPRTGTLVANGRPGQLQFFNVKVNRQLFSLNVVGHNYVSPETLKKPLLPTDIEKAAFDSKGNWLITYERRDDGITATESRLKFWYHSSEKSSFVLNTCIEMPHHEGIAALKFRPCADDNQLIAASSSSDGSIKLWSLVEEGDGKAHSFWWSCSGIGVYQGQPAGAMDFSSDGSLLGVAFKDVVTLWYPTYCCMHKEVVSIPVDGPGSDINDIVFAKQTSSHLMMFATLHHLYCWNLLTMSLNWCLPVHATCLTASPTADVLAVFTKDCSLLMLSPKSRHAVYEHRNITDKPVLMACFLPTESQSEHDTVPWLASSRLYFMTAKQELCTLTNKSEADMDSQKTVPLQQNVKQSVVSILMSGDGNLTKLPVSNLNTMQPNEALTARSKFVSEAMNGQFIAMPPMSLLCTAFMETLLLPGTVAAAAASESDSDDDNDANLVSDDSVMDTS